MAEELGLDLEELRQLQSIAKRPRIQSLIASEIRNLEKLQTSKEEAKALAPAFVPTPISTSVKVSVNSSLSYVTLASFSWDQDNDKIKIYVSLEGVEQEKIQAEFKPMSIDAKFHDVQGKSYRCAIPKLNKEIVPEKCKVIVKPTRAIITLFKASKGNWPDLYFKEDKLKLNLDKEKITIDSDDPAAVAQYAKVMKTVRERADLFLESQKIHYTIQSRIKDIPDYLIYLLTVKDIRIKRGLTDELGVEAMTMDALDKVEKKSRSLL